MKNTQDLEQLRVALKRMIEDVEAAIVKIEKQTAEIDGHPIFSKYVNGKEYVSVDGENWL